MIGTSHSCATVLHSILNRSVVFGHGERSLGQDADFARDLAVETPVVALRLGRVAMVALWRRLPDQVPL
jgi:hypothetical protein